MADPSTINAAVVGAGVGGLATATLLARAGFDVTVYESRSQPLPGGADYGVALQANGLVVLEVLGVIDDLAAVGSHLSHMRLFDEYMHTVVEVEAPTFSHEAPDDDSAGIGPILVVPHHHLLERLTAVAVGAGAKLEYGQRLNAVDTEGPLPRLHVGGRSEVFDLVVGADGIESVARRVLYHGDEDRPRRRKYARGTFDWGLSPTAAGQYWTRRGVAELLPCGEGRTYWFATVTPQMQAAADSDDLERFRRAVASAHPPLLQTIKALASLDDVDFSYSRPLELPRFYEGAVVLVGDAAHPMEPMLAQGANTALLDAGVLASEMHRREHPAEALAAYQARREEPIREVSKDADRLAKVAHFTHGRRLRNMMVKMVPANVYTQAATRIAQNDLAALRRELRELDSGR